MPNDNNREMLTEVVALYLAAHMKAQAAVITTLVSILVQKGDLTEQIVRAEWLGGLEEVVRATLESPQATNPDEARASRIEIETLRQVVDWIRQRLFPSGAICPSGDHRRSRPSVHRLSRNSPEMAPNLM